VQTGNCYDSVIQRNLNTGLPKRVSYITDKDLIGKKKSETGKSKAEYDVPYEEKELDLKLRRLWAIQKNTEARFKEQENEKKLEER